MESNIWVGYRPMTLGIDYGLGMANIDHSTGIRFGVIPANDVGQAWYDESEADYGQAGCPVCGNDATEYDDDVHGEYPDYDESSPWHRPIVRDYACEECHIAIGTDNCWPESPYGFYVEEKDSAGARTLLAHCGEDGDIFIEVSPYFTYAGFCSPCAPGAGHLRSILDAESGVRTYCFDHSWFEGGRAPYPVYLVATGEVIEPGD